MPNSLSNLTDSIVETGSITHTIGNIARAATTRHRHSTHLSSSALSVPPPPQHTNVHPQDTAHTDHTASSIAQSPSSASHLDHRRSSQAGLIEGQTSNMIIEFDGGTHVIVRPNRIIRGNTEKKIENIHV